MSGACECVHELSGSIKCGKFLDYLMTLGRTCSVEFNLVQFRVKKTFRTMPSYFKKCLLIILIVSRIVVDKFGYVIIVGPRSELPFTVVLVQKPSTLLKRTYCVSRNFVHLIYIYIYIGHYLNSSQR